MRAQHVLIWTIIALETIISLANSQKCNLNTQLTDYSYFYPDSATNYQALKSSADADVTSRDSFKLPSYKFRFEMPSSENNVTRQDWILQAVLDLEQPISKALQIDISMPQRSEFVLSFEPLVREFDDSTPEYEVKTDYLEASLTITGLTFGTQEIIKSNIFQIDDFWDKKMEIELRIQDDANGFNIEVLLNGAGVYNSKDDPENWDSKDFEDVKAIIRDYKGEVVYRPMYRFMRSANSFYDYQFLKKYSKTDPMMSLSESYAEDSAFVLRKQTLNVYDGLKDWKVFQTFNFDLAQGTKADANKDYTHKLTLYDNIAEKSLYVKPVEKQAVSEISIDQKSLDLTMKIGGDLTNEGAQFLKTNPMRMQIDDFVAGHELILSFTPTISSEGQWKDVEYPITVYLQLREFPFSIVSAIETLKNSEFQYDITQTIILRPVFGQDVVMDSSRKVDLVFDITQNMESQMQGSFDITMKNIVLLRQGGRPPCLVPLNQAYITVRDEFTEIDLGFYNRELNQRKIFIVFAMIIVILLVIVLSMCIYKSFTQKKKRINFMTYQNKTEKFKKIRTSLENDRQVKLAIQFLEQQPGYKDFGVDKSKGSNPQPNNGGAQIQKQSPSQERSSAIGLLKKTNTQEEQVPNSEIKLSNPLAQENNEYFEQQTDPTLSNKIQTSELDQENEGLRLEQQEEQKNDGQAPKVEFNKNPLVPDESSDDVQQQEDNVAEIAKMGKEIKTSALEDANI